MTRQVHYSPRNPNLSLDLTLFINGLPVITFELKNNLTKQTVEDAVEQYKRDRDPREDLFRPGRCAAHMAVDENRVRFCTELAGLKSVFLPFDKGHDGGAGNPPNPQGLRTDYLWQETLTPGSLTDIIENYAQQVQGKQVWPRYHQLESVRRILYDASLNGAGRKYLIQHSAGSGKSNSIAWLARQLIGLQKDSKTIFGSTIIVTDRVVLDSQISETVKQFTQVNSTVGHAESSGDLRRLITEGKKIIITTVQKFPFIAKAMAEEHLGRRFAIIIDEAHSSQGGQTSAKMNAALGDQADDEEEDYEDQINRIIEGRKMLDNASYFAFTATPKNKTLELFGDASPQTRRDREAPGLPQLHDEAGHPGRLHPGRARQLHEHPELLQPRQDDRRRPRVRLRARPAAPAPPRRGARVRRQGQGRDHGGPLQRVGVQPKAHGRESPSHGGDRRRKPRHRLLPGHQRLHQREENCPSGPSWRSPGSGTTMAPESARHC